MFALADRGHSRADVNGKVGHRPDDAGFDVGELGLNRLRRDAGHDRHDQVIVVHEVRETSAGLDELLGLDRQQQDVAVLYNLPIVVGDRDFETVGENPPAPFDGIGGDNAVIKQDRTSEDSVDNPLGGIAGANDSDFILARDHIVSRRDPSLTLAR